MRCIHGTSFGLCSISTGFLLGFKAGEGRDACVISVFILRIIAIIIISIISIITVLLVLLVLFVLLLLLVLY